MELLAVVRRAIYRHVVEGSPTSVDAVAAASGLDVDQVSTAYRALADGHVIILRPGTLDLWAAPPFACVPTPFRVRAGGRLFYAPCAWDAFGIPAALKQDAVIDAESAQTGTPIPCGVSDRMAWGDAVIHLLVPARRFWDDIFYT